MKYHLTRQKNISFFIFIAVALLVLIGLSAYMVSHLVQARKNVELQKSALALEGAIYHNQLLIQAQVLSDPGALIGSESRFGILASNIFKENPSIVALELRDEKGGLSAELLNPSYGKQNFVARSSLPPWLLHQYMEATKRRAPSYSTPYNSGLLSPVNDLNNSAYLIEQYIPLGEKGRILVVVLLPQAWFIEPSIAHVLDKSKAQAFQIQTQNGITIASSGDSLRSTSTIISSIHVPLELPGISLSLLAEEHESWRGEIDSIIPFVAGLCGFIVVLLALFLRSLYLQFRAETRLRNQEELMLDQARLASLGEMTSVLSHELNQPIAAIEAYASAAKNLLEENAYVSSAGDSSNQMLKALNMVTEQAHRAAEIIKSIRNLFSSKSSSYEDVLVSELLDSLLPLIGVQAERFQSKFTVVYEKDYLIRVNRLLCEQVFLNLARNAFQAMTNVPPAKRSLKILVSDAKKHFCKIAFIDRGEGVSDEIANNLFKPFFSSKADGMGLGLSLSRTLVERFGGELSWKNMPSRGAEFAILLPVQE